MPSRRAVASTLKLVGCILFACLTSSQVNANNTTQVATQPQPGPLHEVHLTRCQLCCLGMKVEVDGKAFNSCLFAFENKPAHCCGVVEKISYCCPNSAKCVTQATQSLRADTSQRRSPSWRCHGHRPHPISKVNHVDGLQKCFGDLFVTLILILIIIVFLSRRAPRQVQRNNDDGGDFDSDFDDGPDDDGDFDAEN